MSLTALFHRGRVADNATEFLVALEEIDDAGHPSAMDDPERDLVVPARRPVQRFMQPLPPEPPSEARAGLHSAISSHDEWEDEQVVEMDLSDQVADGVRLARCELHRVTLTGSQLRGLSLVDVLLLDCELSGALLHEAHLQRVEFRNCRMAGVVLTQAHLNHVLLVGCKLDEANFRLAQADHLQMSDCSIVDADYYEARLDQSALNDCDLRGADFSKASLRELRLGGSRLDGIRGASSMAGTVVSGEQVLPLALSLFADLRIEIQNED